MSSIKCISIKKGKTMVCHLSFVLCKETSSADKNSSLVVIVIAANIMSLSQSESIKPKHLQIQCEFELIVVKSFLKLCIFLIGVERGIFFLFLIFLLLSSSSRRS